jgi:catalase (peroxidase I)
MAAETSSAQALKDNFAAKGFTVRELVALSGAHTLGKCSSVVCVGMQEQGSAQRLAAGGGTQEGKLPDGPLAAVFLATRTE